MFARQRLINLIGGMFSVCACAAACSTRQASTDDVSARSECPDLSGNYMIQGQDGQVHIDIEQERCDRVTIRRDNGYLGTITSERHVLKLDGAVQEDSAWLGSTGKATTAAKFNDSVLQLEATTTNGSTLTMIYSMSPDGDLLEHALINGREAGGPVAAKRQK